MVWGSMIAWYLFLAGASAGAFLTSAFVEAKYPDSVKMRVAGRIISPIFLGIGLLMLMLDAEAGLHNPLRFFYLIMNPGSVMTLGVYFIACSCRCPLPRRCLRCCVARCRSGSPGQVSYPRSAWRPTPAFYWES